MNFQFNSVRRAVKVALLSAFALGGAALSTQSLAVQATSTSTGTVIMPIELTKGADLSFGKFARGAGGSITVSTSGARTVSGVIPSTVGSTPTAAKFNVKGDPNATYSITHSGATAFTTGTGAANETMTLTKFSDLTGGNITSGNVSSGTLDAGGLQTIYVGGTLTVGSAQVAGAYKGDIIVTVEYN